MINSPPNCRPECLMSSDCAPELACIRQKCENPCSSSSCGIDARCTVVNHSPICSCPPSKVGDPFLRCIDAPEQPLVHDTNPCSPSPCGANSICKEVNGHAACSCLPFMKGTPPSCRPECTDNSECQFNLACINYQCRDPCENACGVNAECTVLGHQARCYCSSTYTGNAFIACSPCTFHLYFLNR